jgi:hypothetical protein
VEGEGEGRGMDQSPFDVVEVETVDFLSLPMSQSASLKSEIDKTLRVESNNSDNQAAYVCVFVLIPVGGYRTAPIFGIIILRYFAATR